MIRMTKMTDYGFVLLTHMAAAPEHSTHNAADLARTAGLPQPMVSKILKVLARKGLLSSRRGPRGGYELSRRAERISAAEVIAALEGPIALTECLSAPYSGCEIELLCPNRAAWRRINDAVREALDRISLAELLLPLAMPRFREPGGVEPAREAVPVTAHAGAGDRGAEPTN